MNGYDTFFYWGQSPYTDGSGTMTIQTGADGASLNMDVSGDNGGSPLALLTWYHIALVRNGNSFTVYLNGVSDITATVAWTLTNSKIVIMNAVFAGGEMNGRMAALKLWTANLTQAEILREMRSYRVKRTANLYGWWPMLGIGDDEIDYSGNGRDWTVGGTLATEDGPPISWK